MSRYAPVAVFAYRRARGLARTLDTLERCPEFGDSPVFVFSDGAKEAAGQKDVGQVRALLDSRQRPNITVIKATANKGLARSIIDGVTRLCDEYGRAIVLEDDLQLSPATLTWMNAGLDAYRDDETVMQVSAHTFRAPEFAGRDHGHFLPFSTTWGWATWKRAWDRFDAEATGWQSLATDPALSRAFDLNGAYPYSEMLRAQMAAGIDSWGIRWYWTIFRNGGRVLYPPQTLVRNRGVDLKATHGVRSLFLASLRPASRRLRMNTPTLPASVQVSPDDLAATIRAIKARRL